MKVKVGNVFDFPNIDETRQAARQLVQTMLATKRNFNKIKRETDASELETVIKIVLHEGKPIHFATTVIAFSSDRYLELCDLYSSQAIGNYLRRITASFLACDLNAEMGRKTRNLDAITNGQWYLLKAISLPIMQGGLILYNSISRLLYFKKDRLPEQKEPVSM